MADQEILPAEPNGTSGAAAAPMQAMPASSNFDRLKNLAQQPAVQKAMPLLLLAGTLMLSAAAWWSLQSPAQMPIYQGLNDTDKGAIAEALQAAGIDYSIDRSTGTVQVDEDQLHRARMMLASQGLPKAAPSGDALIASLPMGSSRAVEGETLRGAREADLSRTIEAIDAVQSARIHLATPQPSVFVRDQSKPAASVMLTLHSGRSLSAGQVRAIRHLVASSVPGMAPEDVSILDQSGALLSQKDVSGNQNRNFELQMQMEQRYRQALNTLLAPIVGADHYSAEVSAILDYSESQSTRETYPDDDRALRREEGVTSRVNGQAGEAAGIPGALANQPPEDAQVADQQPGAAAGAANEAANNESYMRSFEVGREISVTHQPYGRLQRLTVAVALRDPKGGKARSDAELKAIEKLVKGAVGFNAERGDVVAISSRPFAEADEAESNWWDEPWVIPLARQVGGVLVALLLLFFLGRPLRKMMRERRERAEEKRELLEDQLLTATEGGKAQEQQAPSADEITIEMIEAAPSYEARAELVRHFVRQDATRAAMVVRQLMQEAKDDD